MYTEWLCVAVENASASASVQAWLYPGYNDRPGPSSAGARTLALV